MPHDGQDMPKQDSALLAGLLDLTRATIAPVDAVLERAVDTVRGTVSENGKVSAALIERHQTAAHGLAWLATYAQALRQMQTWARIHGRWQVVAAHVSIDLSSLQE